MTAKQSFVDLGCGNGLLVHILSSEGVKHGSWSFLECLQGQHKVHWGPFLLVRSGFRLSLAVGIVTGCGGL